MSFVMLVKSPRYRVILIHVSSKQMIILISDGDSFADRFEQRCLSLRSSDDDTNLPMLWTCHRKVSTHIFLQRWIGEPSLFLV